MEMKIVSSFPKIVVTDMVRQVQMTAETVCIHFALMPWNLFSFEELCKPK